MAQAFRKKSAFGVFLQKHNITQQHMEEVNPRIKQPKLSVYATKGIPRTAALLEIYHTLKKMGVKEINVLDLIITPEEQETWK
jgi:hypothetical protein